MAALDFPASPTNGQVYGNYIYSTSKGAWQAKPITGKVTTSATAPSAPTNGDEWFNTNDGNLYVYYTDVDGSQWVQVKSDATLSSTLGNRVTTLETYPSGMVPVIPTSVSVASGSASVNSAGTITFTGASSISINGVFTSAYRNYKVVYNARNTANNTQSSWLRLRGAGADVVTNYIYQGPDGVINSAGTNSNASTGGWNSNAMLVGYFAPTSGSGTIEIMEPAVAASTGFHNTSQCLNSSTNAFYSRLVQGENSIGSSYDGFTIYPQADSITGTFTIYGYRNQ